MNIRKRIGVMVPSTNTTCEADFQLVAPPGVTVHGQRLWLTNEGTGDRAFERMNAEIQSGARYLSTARVDVIVYGCTTGSFFRGPGLRGAQRRRRAARGRLRQPGHQRPGPGVGGGVRLARVPARGGRAALLLHRVALGGGGERHRGAHRAPGGELEPVHHLGRAAGPGPHAAHHRPRPPPGAPGPVRAGGRRLARPRLAPPRLARLPRMGATVACVGMGLLGSALAENLIRAGFTVRGYDVAPERVREHVVRGGVPATSPADAARGAAIVVTCLMTAEIVREVLLGRDGALETAGPDPVAIDCSTIHPDASAALAADLAGRGVPMLDAPVA